jgi:hypothetical protein
MELLQKEPPPPSIVAPAVFASWYYAGACLLALSLGLASRSSLRRPSSNIRPAPAERSRRRSQLSAREAEQHTHEQAKLGGARRRHPVHLLRFALALTCAPRSEREPDNEYQDQVASRTGIRRSCRGRRRTILESLPRRTSVRRGGRCDCGPQSFPSGPSRCSLERSGRIRHFAPLQRHNNAPRHRCAETELRRRLTMSLSRMHRGTATPLFRGGRVSQYAIIKEHDQAAPASEAPERPTAVAS